MLAPPCWSSLDVDSNTRTHCWRRLGRDWMLPLPLNVLAPRYPKTCRVRSLDDSDGREKRLPTISSISVPAERMQEFSTASAYLFLQVQCCSFFGKCSLLRVILLFSHHMEMEMTHTLEECPGEHLHGRSKGLLFMHRSLSIFKA